MDYKTELSKFRQKPGVLVRKAPSKHQILFFFLILTISACSDQGEKEEPTLYKIAFSSRSFNASADIYLIDSNGENLRAVTAHPSIDDYPLWSPDGKNLLFTSNREGSWNLYLYNLVGDTINRLTFGRGDHQNGDWSPDGSRIAYQSNLNGNDDIYVFDILSGEIIGLTDNLASDITPHWSPDGRQVAFVSTRDGNAEIYVMNADGSDQTRLTDATRVDLEPSWSPDGSRIAFSTHRKSSDEHIYVVNAEGGEPVQIQTIISDEYNPVWSADGQRLYYYNINLGKIYSSPADSIGTPEVIFEFGAAVDLSLSPDGQTLVFAASVGDSPAAVYILNLETREFQRVTNTMGIDRSPKIMPENMK